MRLLVFLLLPALAAGFFLNIDGDSLPAMIKKLRKAEFYDEMKEKLWKATEQWKIPKEYKEPCKKVHGTLWDILKAIVPNTAQPTPEKLEELSNKLADATAEFYAAYKATGTTSLIIYKIATNSTMLTMDYHVPDDPHPSASKFALAVRRVDNNHIVLYGLATFTRCFFDKTRSFPKTHHLDDKAFAKLEERYSKAAKECMSVFGFDVIMGPLRSHDLSRSETLEFFQSRKNMEVVVKGLAILVATIKNPQSYRSVDDFIASLQGSRRLRAVSLIFKQILRCGVQVQVQGLDKYNEGLKLMSNVSKLVFTDDTEQDDEELKNALAQFMASYSGLVNISELEFSKLEEKREREKEEQFMKCILPDSAIEKAGELKLVSTGDIAEEENYLKKIGNINKVMEAVMLLYYEHLRGLRNRVGMNDETNEFFTTVVRKMDAYASSDGSTPEGKSKIDADLQDLRKSFNDLSAGAKKVFADHFPYRSAILLSILY